MPSIKKVKKEKLDLNPKRVQDPTESHKRSPGKFDQRVFMEQELQGTNATRNYSRISNLQQRQTIRTFDQKISSMKNRHIGLKTKSAEYAYLRVLRTALDKEQEKRNEQLAERVRCFHNVEAVKRANALPPILSAEPPQLAADAEKAENQLSDLDKLQLTQQPVAQSTENNSSQHLESEKQTSSTLLEQTNNLSDQHQAHPTDNATTDELENEKDDYSVAASSLNLIRRGKSEKERMITPSRQAMLESLSYEIMTRTLPIQKLKRILPDRPPPVVESYPILSSHRKGAILPIVKKTQHHLEKDMVGLKDRLSNYFGEEFPLTLYKYIPNEKPRRVRLIKAISRENIKLPHLPGR